MSEQVPFWVKARVSNSKDEDWEIYGTGWINRTEAMRKANPGLDAVHVTQRGEVRLHRSGRAPAPSGTPAPDTQSTSIPLPKAVLCLNCESVVNFQSKCPTCGSEVLMPLANIIGSIKQKEV